jgi:hypothetical protein
MTESTPAPAPAPAPAPTSAPTPPPPEQPVLWYLGQRITPEAAAQTRASLMADPKFSAAAIGGDKEKLQQLAALWQLERSIQPPAPTTEAEIRDQGISRYERDRAAHTAALRSAAEGITDEQVRQIQLGRPIPREEKEIAVRHLETLKRDKDFVRRYLDGDRAAGLEMRLTTIAARALPIGSLDQIKAWEQAHPK